MYSTAEVKKLDIPVEAILHDNIPSDELWTGEGLAMQCVDCEDVAGPRTTKQMEQPVMSSWYIALM
jgi:hypothetical protein